MEREESLHIAYLVTKPAHVSGGMRVIAEHLNGLLKRGHKAEMWVMGEEAQPIFECDAPIIKLDYAKLAIPDIVVVCDPMFLPHVDDSRGQKSVFLFLQHDQEWIDSFYEKPSFIGLVNNYTQRFVSRAWHVLVVSAWLQQVVLEKYGLESVLIPNGIDHTLFKPAQPILETSGQTILLYYDHQPWKGFPDAVSAALEVQKSRKDVNIAVLGSILSWHPDANPVYQNFSFPVIAFNNPEQQDLAAIYSSSSVFVSASLKEGFGLPSLEAMACGVPVVAVDGGGNREYAIPEKTAVLVQPQNVAALASAILRVLDDQELREKLTTNGISKAREFSWEKSALLLEETFTSTMVKG